MLGIISDIHGNLEALDATFAAGAKLGVDEWICLGDVVGYGANPNECVQRVALLCSVVLFGNHDEAAIGGMDLSWFNPWAAEAAQWTIKALTPESWEFLSDRPYRHETSSATFVHGTPIEPEAWNYILDERDARAQATGFMTPLCFVGHSHVPGIFPVDPAQGNDEPRSIINVGSVGQPRDGDPRACMVVVTETEEGAASVRFVRVAYDVGTAQRKIVEAGLPEVLARRLAVGG